MEILELKSTISKMKNSLEGLNRFELTRKKRLLNLGTSQEKNLKTDISYEHMQILNKIQSNWISVQFSRSLVSNSLQPHGWQHARPPCPSWSPEVCPSSCPLHRWYHPAISSSDTLFSFCPQSFPALQTFSNESVLCIRWPKYWSFMFSISPSNEYTGLISLKIDWFDLLAV